MSTTETPAVPPRQSKKKKQTGALGNERVVNGQSEPSETTAKKRGRQGNGAEDEQPRKKRVRDKKGLDKASHRAEGSDIRVRPDRSPEVIVDTPTTSKKATRSRPTNITDVEIMDSATSEGIISVTQELHEAASHTSEPKKGKKRRDKPPQSIIPVDSTPLLDLSDIPIDPALLGDYDYDPDAPSFNDAAIGFSTLGMSPSSNADDILRAIKGMDLSTLTRAAGQEPVPDQPVEDHGIAKKKRSRAHSRNEVTPRYNPGDPQGLLGKWLSAEKLKELAEKHGLEYVKGPFTDTEKAAVQTALDSFAMVHNISSVDVVELFFRKRGMLQDEYRSLWVDISSAVPKRPIVSVFNYCRRAYHPLQKQGKWTKEEDAALKAAVVEFGQQWTKVSGRVGRTSHDCRDRYRNHIVDSNNRVHGTWKKEEEDTLVRIMAEFNYERPKGEENDVFWSEISRRMGGSRNRAQIRAKWEDNLSKNFKPEGKRRWLPIDSYILVHKIATMNVADESEIDWRLLADEGWNLWSPHIMQRHWCSMKKGVDGYENMPFYELLEVLIAKKGSLSQSEIEEAIKRRQEIGTPRSPRVFTSKEFIDKSDDGLE